MRIGREQPMEQMSIFDFVPDPNIKYDAMHIKWQERNSLKRGSTTLYVTEKTWYDELKKWRSENGDKYYFLGVEWEE